MSLFVLDWRYDPGPKNPAGNLSMVCSSFVAHAYRAGFGLHWPPVNATEFSPKDVYQLQIFADNDRPRFANSSQCANIIESDRGSYCQVTGDVKLVLNDHNSVAVTEQMNNFCAAQWPGYQTTRPC